MKFFYKTLYSIVVSIAFSALVLAFLRPFLEITDGFFKTNFNSDKTLVVIFLFTSVSASVTCLCLFDKIVKLIFEPDDIEVAAVYNKEFNFKSVIKLTIFVFTIIIGLIGNMIYGIMYSMLKTPFSLGWQFILNTESPVNFANKDTWLYTVGYLLCILAFSFCIGMAFTRFPKDSRKHEIHLFLTYHNKIFFIFYLPYALYLLPSIFVALYPLYNKFILKDVDAIEVSNTTYFFFFTLILSLIIALVGAYSISKGKVKEIVTKTDKYLKESILAICGVFFVVLTVLQAFDVLNVAWNQSVVDDKVTIILSLDCLYSLFVKMVLAMIFYRSYFGSLLEKGFFKSRKNHNLHVADKEYDLFFVYKNNFSFFFTLLWGICGLVLLFFPFMEILILLLKYGSLSPEVFCSHHPHPCAGLTVAYFNNILYLIFGFMIFSQIFKIRSKISNQSKEEAPNVEHNNT